MRRFHFHRPLIRLPPSYRSFSSSACHLGDSITPSRATDVPHSSPAAAENQKWIEYLDKQAVEAEEATSHPESGNIDSNHPHSDNDFLSSARTQPVKAMFEVRQFNPYTSQFSHLPSSLRPKLSQSSTQMFSDMRTITVTSGRGGNGSASFFRDAGRAQGPPDGGNGGDGGSVYIQAVAGLWSLHKLKNSYTAGDGRNGLGRQLDGASGEDVVIYVPVGTTVRWVPDPKDLRRLLVDRLKEKEIEKEKEEVENRRPYKSRTKYGPDGEVLEVYSDAEDTLSRRFMTKEASLQSWNEISNELIEVPVFPDPYDPSVPQYIHMTRNSYPDGEGWIHQGKDGEYHESKSFFKSLKKKIKYYDRQLRLEELAADQFPFDGIDLDEPTPKPMLLVKGGKGGLGNMHFLTNEIRNPRFCLQGRGAAKASFLLELKLLADLGLVGLPNAGKSTLLRAISKARPQVGHWEFTTLTPTIGTISTGIDKPPFTVADIPGIIEGASQNKGMGLDFLRHIERSGGLVFVIGLDSKVNPRNKDPVSALNILLKELGPDRTEGKNILIVATKADVEGSQENYRDLLAYINSNPQWENWNVIPVCALKRENVEQVISMMAKTAGKG